jgi:hypothetical protein
VEGIPPRKVLEAAWMELSFADRNVACGVRELLESFMLL